MNLTMPQHFLRIAPLTLALLLSACASTRVAPPTAAPAPAQFKEDALWKRAASSTEIATPVPDAWWQLYNDPVLNDLQARLIVGNENLKAAVAQVASARAAISASRAAELPTVSANPSASRSGAPVGNIGQRNNNTSLSLGATASWEIDLWDRLSQATSGSEAKYQASVDDLAAARLSAQATLVQTYLSMRAAEAQASLLERSTAGYQRSLDLTQTRYNAGVVARTDVLQAQTQLKSVQAIRLGGIASVLLCGAAVIYGIRKLFDKRIGLKVDENGITDNTNAVSVGLINWTDITEIKTKQVRYTKFLLIFTSNPDKYLERVGTLQRKIMQANMLMYGTPLSISSNTLKYNFADLEKIILKFQKEQNKRIPNR